MRLTVRMAAASIVDDVIDRTGASDGTVCGASQDTAVVTRRVHLAACSRFMRSAMLSVCIPYLQNEIL